MLRFSCPTMLMSALLLPTLLSAEELPDRILKYFPGKWTYTGAEPGQTGSVDYKVVAGGKAVAGPGTDSKNGDWFALGRWQAQERIWEHAWGGSKGGYGHVQIERFENDTYYGKARVVEGDGKLIAGEAQVKIVDPDNFEYTVMAGTTKLTSKWRRSK